LGALATVTAAAWAYLLLDAGIETDMGGGQMMVMPSAWSPPYGALISLMWWVMMVAMMLPTAAPTCCERSRRDKCAALGAVLTALIDRIEVSVDRIDIRLHPSRLGALLDVTATPLQSATDDEIPTLSVPVCLRRAGREIRMVLDGPQLSRARSYRSHPRGAAAARFDGRKAPRALASALAWHDQRTVLGFA
jgi:hypothetical protein